MKAKEFSQWVVKDTRPLLWIITIASLVLAFVCVFTGYAGALPWISAMVGLPWAAHGTICAFYLNLAKSDHREGGITYAKAQAKNFDSNVEI